MTNAETLKANIISLLEEMLNEKEMDITSGVEEGIYDAEENKDTLAGIDLSRKMIEEFKFYQPKIYLYIEGGNLQGVSATETMHTEIYDKDNFEQSGEEEAAEMGTPDEWEAQIKALTDSQEITGIY